MDGAINEKGGKTLHTARENLPVVAQQGETSVSNMFFRVSPTAYAMHVVGKIFCYNTASNPSVLSITIVPAVLTI